jgi:hypothetical protein
VTKYIKYFLQFTNTIDFNKLWTHQPVKNKCI